MPSGLVDSPEDAPDRLVLNFEAIIDINLLTQELEH
jgi:hypothetical protein